MQDTIVDEFIFEFTHSVQVRACWARCARWACCAADLIHRGAGVREGGLLLRGQPALAVASGQRTAVPTGNERGRMECAVYDGPPCGPGLAYP